MKRFIKIVAVLTSILIVATTCGFATGKAQKEATANLTVAWLVTGAQPTDLSLVQDAINKVVTPKINAKVTLLPINFGAAMQQYNLMLSSGEKLDLMMTFPMTYASLVSQGKIQEIGPLMDMYGKGVKDAMGKFYKSTLINGKTYGVRPLCDMAGGGGLCIRHDIVAKYNINLSKVKSLADVTEVLKTIKSHEPNAYPLSFSNQQIGIVAMLALFDIDNLSDNFGVLENYGNSLKVVDMFECKEYVSELKLIRDWYQKGYIMKDISTNKEDQHSLIASGKTYCYFTPTKPGIESQESSQNGFKCDVQQFSVPFAQSGSPTFAWVVPDACDHPDKAVQLLNLMYTNADLENLLSWGIEGKHYVKKADGTVGFPNGVTDKNSGYYLQEPWMMGNEFLSHVWTGNSPNLWKDTIKFNASAKFSKALGFTYDPSSVKTEIASVTNVYNQYRLALENGSVDFNKTYPEFIKKIKAAGLEKIIALKQKQLDAWAKVNNIK